QRPAQAPDLQTPVEPDPDEDIFKQFQPETRAQDEYFNLIKNLPVRTKPSTGTRILAGLSTLGQGGLKQAENVKYGDYNRQVGDLQLKAGMLKDLAASKRGANNKEPGEQAAKRIKLQEFRDANPNSKFVRLGNGNYGVADPQTGEITDSGVKYGLSPLEDIMLERGSTQERLATQQQHAKEMEDIRQQHRVALEQLQQQLKEALDRNKPLTPEQEKVGQYLRAQEVFNSDPGNKKFMKLGDPGTNTFQIVLPSALPEWTGWGAEQRQANAQRYIDINKRIYGPAWNPPADIKRAAEGTPEAGRARQNTAPINTPSQGRKRRYDKVTDKTEESLDGGKTWKVVGKGRIP